MYAQKTTGPRLRAALLIPFVQRGLLTVAATLLSATGTTATAATTTATTLLLITAGTIAALGGRRTCRCGHSLFALFGFIGIRFVIDFEAFRLFVIIIEVGSALESDGVL